ncbi:MAG: YlxM family DNA-binding protein [Lachnospiraceae bacterium]
MEEVNELLELAMLYDFYGELLKEHNKRIFEDYILNDFSLSEIADTEGITRQGVHDIVKRCSVQLRGYEAKLHLVEKFNRTKECVERIQVLLRRTYDTGDLASAKEAQALTEEILNGL